jgi:hypothetical protein
MKIADAEASFRRYLETHGISVEDADALDTILAMVDWYEAERAEDAVAIEDDGDQLLFQWGTSDWGDGPALEIGLSRQFIDLASDGPISQLVLVYRYPASAETEKLYDDAWWCRGPLDAPGFRKDVLSTDVARFAARKTPTARRLAFEAAG